MPKISIVWCHRNWYFFIQNNVVLLKILPLLVENWFIWNIWSDFEELSVPQQCDNMCKIRLMLNSLIMDYQRFMCKCLEYKNKRMMSRYYFKQILYVVLFSHRVIFALLLFETFSFRLEFAQTQWNNFRHWNTTSFKFARWQGGRKGRK